MRINGPFLTKTVAAALLVAAFCLAGCGRAARPYQETQFALDTIIEITAYGDHAKQGVEAAFAEMRRLEALLSNYIKESEVSRINRQAGGEPVAVSDDTLRVVAQAVAFARATGGAFDPTIGPVTELWGIGKKGDYVPPEQEIAAALRLVDYRQVEIDAAHKTIRLAKKGMALDLGGVAKGYILGRMAEVLRQHDVKSALINGGGDIRVIGRKPDGTPWRIGIQHPRQADAIAAKITLDKWNVVTTSGDYQRYFDKNGVRYHHIFDPKTGRPTHTLPSVTLLANEAAGAPDAAADIPSNEIMVMGKEKGLAFLKQHYPKVEAVLIDYDGSVTYTPGLAGSIETGR